MKKLYWPILALLFACSSNQKSQMNSTQSLNDVEINAKKYTLDNGMTLILARNPKLPIYSFYSYYQVGSIYEYSGITGSAHFLEHMMFKGAKKFGAGKFDTIIEGNGGSSNAYTNYDSTVYYEQMPKSTLDLIVKVEADRMQNLLLEPEAFEKERNVILEERKMRYENSPRGKLYLKTFEHLFRGTPYGRSVIGDIADLKSVSRDQMMEFFSNYYAPNNAILVIAGDLDYDDTYEMVEEAFSSIKKNESLQQIKSEMEKPEKFKFQPAGEKHYKYFANTENPIFMLAYQGEKVGTRKAYVLDLLQSILSSGKSSYLNQKYVQSSRPKLAYIYAANYNLTYSGTFYFMAELLKGTSLKSVEKNLKRTLDKVCKDEVINKRSIQKVLNQFMAGMYQGMETNSGLASILGDQEMYYGDYKNYKKMLKTYETIGPDEVIGACREIFNHKNSVFVSVWNKYKK